MNFAQSSQSYLNKNNFNNFNKHTLHYWNEFPSTTNNFYQTPNREDNMNIQQKRDKVKNYEMKLIEIKKRKCELKRKTLDEEINKKKEIKSKESQNEKLKWNIVTLKNEINQLLNQLENNRAQEKIQFHSNKENYLNQIKENISELKNARKQIKKLKETEKEKRENEKMCEEEIYLIKKQLLNITSKMESHIELIASIEQGNKNILQILTPKSNTEFTNDITMTQYKTLNKIRLWNFMYDKIKILKKNFEIEGELREEEIKYLNEKELSEKEIFMTRMIKLEEENFKNSENSKNFNTGSSNSPSENFSNLTKLFISEIQNFLQTQNNFVRNSPFESDLKIILLSHIKLLIYEDSITKRMELLDKLKMNKIASNNNINICELYDKINKKVKKIKRCKHKLQLIAYEEQKRNEDEEMNLINIKSMEKDIETMNKMQQQNEIEVEIMKKELKVVIEKYEDKLSYYKSKKNSIKNKIKQLKESIEGEEDTNRQPVVIDNKNRLNQNEFTLNKNYNDNEITGNYEYNRLNNRNKYEENLNVNKEIDEVGYNKGFFRTSEKFNNANMNLNMIDHSTPAYTERNRNRDRDKSADAVDKKMSNTFCNFTNAYTTPHFKLKEENVNSTPIVNQNKLGQDLFYDINTRHLIKQELTILDKIRPLVQGNTVYKRYHVNIHKKQLPTTETLAFNPVDYNKCTLNNPEDFNFFKCFLCIDKSMSKLLFNKIKENDKSFEINLTSISKIVVPKITKDTIFIKQIYKKINGNRNKITDANAYIERNLGKLVRMYSNEIRSELAEIDEKLFIEEYRKLLIQSNKYMLYVYLKPDEETRIELIFNEYEDFKHWINGLENVLKNKKFIEIIKRRV